MSDSEAEVKKALQDILSLYDIKLEETEEKPEEGDYSEIISKTQQKLDELNEKAALIFERTGMTEEQLEAYSANPNNFTPEQWEALQRVKDACEKYTQEAQARMGTMQFEKKAEQRERKKETHRFAKKKHWIPL